MDQLRTLFHRIEKLLRMDGVNAIGLVKRPPAPAFDFIARDRNFALFAQFSDASDILTDIHGLAQRTGFCQKPIDARLFAPSALLFCLSPCLLLTPLLFFDDPYFSLKQPIIVSDFAASVLAFCGGDQLLDDICNVALQSPRCRLAPFRPGILLH